MCYLWTRVHKDCRRDYIHKRNITSILDSNDKNVTKCSTRSSTVFDLQNQMHFFVLRMQKSIIENVFTMFCLLEFFLSRNLLNVCVLKGMTSGPRTYVEGLQALYIFQLLMLYITKHVVSTFEQNDKCQRNFKQKQVLKRFHWSPGPSLQLCKGRHNENIPSLGYK